MFSKIANFFIQNSKLTLVLVFVSMIVWVWSYFVLPKQYNPTIVVPAFQVSVPSIWLSADEVSNLIVSPLENKIMEIEEIDEVYGVAYDNYAWVMAKFKVWTDKEKAKIRINQKLAENMWEKPIWVWNPIITSIDPDELVQITYAIKISSPQPSPKVEGVEQINPPSFLGEGVRGWGLSKEQIQIYLRQIANLVKEKVKTTKNITTMEIVGWLKKDIIIKLNLDKVESRNTDIMQVYSVLKKNNLNSPSWEIRSNQKVFVEVESKLEKIEDLKKIVISNNKGNILYLEDIADIRYWTITLNKDVIYTNNYWTSDSILIWFWKRAWTNAVFVTNDVIKQIDEIKKELPKNIEFQIIQNEWETAKQATNMLLINLAQSVLIVFIVLALYLWTRDAFNTAISIPLSLSLVFLIALLIWDNINKITLFALILVLWMLVDNSTVVVENISRHLKDRINTWKTKLEAVLEGTQEVWVWVILSTLTRLLAFGSMFAVGWMMWEYMWPIPKYAIFALLVSLVLAFSINPWLSYIWAKDVVVDGTGNKVSVPKKTFDIRKYYLSFMKIFLNNKATKKRKVFKVVFWMILFLVIIAPIYFWIFKARMLPKSDQNQIYVWIDAPRSYTFDKMLEIEKYMSSYFLNNDELKLTKEITSTVWQPFMWDFANLFRWWLNRVWEHQISSRINLYNKAEYENKFNKDRPNSESYTILVRDDFKKYLLEKYPDLKIRLLEDPPGPPVIATFMIKIKWDANPENLANFSQKTENKVKEIWSQMWIEDIWNFNSTTYRKLNINIDHDSITQAWISSEQVINTLWIIFSWVELNIIKNKDAKEFNSMYLVAKEQNRDTITNFDKITFTNPEWIKVPLSSFASIDYSFVSPEINTDKREKNTVIYWEMWDNSLVYPVFKLIWAFKNEDFLWDDYKLVSWNPYKLVYEWLNDGKKYIIEWWGEWELTLDTFRDLWIAMWISLLAIYFVLVGQFSSFWIAWIIMITFLLWFFGVFPGFTFLYLFQNEYFSATSMIWVIALAWIVVWNAIILLDYINVLKKNWLTIEDVLLKAWYVRFAPIILTSLTTVFWAATIVWDPVWSWLAWAIIWWLLVSSILTLIVIPIFYYDSQKDSWNKCMEKNKCLKK